MNILWLNKLAWFLLSLLLSAAAWLHFSGRIDLITADLGRHLKNGELFFSNHLILATNFYSYTHPDFSALCHHWGIGPIFYLVWKTFGFNGLSWVYTSILFVTFAVSVIAARRSSSIGAAVLFGVLALPLVGYRIEIRPEGVSTFFLMLEYLLLSGCRAGKLRAGWLWLIPLIQLIWLNVHILFFTGLVLIFIYLSDALVRDTAIIYRRQLLYVTGVSVGALLLSPFSFAVALQPFTIFQGYGYKLVENQSVFFMLDRFAQNPVFGCFLVLFGIGIILIVLRMLVERSWKASLPQALAFLFFGLMAVKSVRAIAMFGFFSIPIMAESLGAVITGMPERVKAGLHRIIEVAAIGLVLCAAAVPYSYYSPLKKFAPAIADGRYKNSLLPVLVHPEVWSGLMPGVGGSADFFISAGLKGPVFNNYDIGGYFIFTLFPQERPFVDNRPEAYPVEFFERLYVPMQEDEDVWKKALNQYGFELVYFYRHDMTPWAQPFLIRRLDDPQWAPVFADAYTIILARRNGVNQAVIARHELPRAMFRTTQK